jgi:hypothetical protein
MWYHVEKGRDGSKMWSEIKLAHYG